LTVAQVRVPVLDANLGTRNICGAGVGCPILTERSVRG